MCPASKTCIALVLSCYLATYIRCAQLDPASSLAVTDLRPLINETLAINNKTGAANASNQEEWTFDMVEYDLMDFLNDLNSRYGANKNESKLEGKLELAKTNSSDSEASTTSAAELGAGSSADADHEIAESSWQYGIFDRFTRPKPSATSTTSTTTELPYDPLVEASNALSRNYNSDECGLRVYHEPPADKGAVYQYPQLESDIGASEVAQSEASKELSLRRQRPALSPAERRKYQAGNSAEELGPNWDREDEEQRERDRKRLSSAGTGATSAPDQPFTGPLVTGSDQQHGSSPASNSDGSTWDSEFNLASRRHWLQQQLGSTLQLLGINASSSISSAQLAALEAANLGQASSPKRENMMKMSGTSAKTARSLPGLAEALASFNLSDRKRQASPEELRARQDELKLEARVIGGSDARLGDSPWSVSLQALVSRPGTGGVEYRHYCGGTIISEYYVLTAAHCLDFMVGRESRLFVVVGDLNWRMSTASLHGRRFGIEKLIIHSGYKSTAFGHDIGLIRTKESMKPLKVNGRYIVNSVCLPERGVEHTGEAELVGWGLFSNRNEMADSLQIADVPILPRSLCVDLYKRRTGIIQWLIGIELITDKQVCAGTFGRGICQGDSGSALVVNERLSQRKSGTQSKKTAKALRSGVSNRADQQQTRATQIGIVAFGGIRRCSYQSLPGVYMQTSKYMDWILPRIQD